MRRLIFVVMLCGLAGAGQAETLRTASGAGYKKVVEQWARLYELQPGADQVERVYGNMGQITAQINQGGGICLAIGDKSYLSTHGLPIVSYAHIGRGRPVLATRKGLTVKALADLAKPDFERISAPDFKKAIYGRAARQILEQEQYRAIKKKVMQVGTVPRSGTYAISGEVDAAFINLSFALANQDKFGSVLELTTGFKPIEIVAGILDGCENNPEVVRFLDLLKSDPMRAYLVAAGL